MPSATVAGALLGLAFQTHANSLRKPRSHPLKHVVAMAVGAVLANQIVKWDNKAQQLKQSRQDNYRAGLAKQAEQANKSDQAL